MKKAVSVFLVVAILFAFTACSSTEYVDTPVTVAVTDENGEAVTDENGQVVTEVVDAQQTSATDSSSNNSTGDDKESSSANSNTNNSSNESSGTTATATKGNATNNNATTANGTTQSTTATTTAKPKKRNVAVTVVLPYYNGQETEVTVSYKVDGDKKYTTLATEKVALSKSGEKLKYTIEDVKGDVDVKVEFDGIEISSNTATVASGEKEVTISPVTGIEIMDGGLI
jgi:hypothetical protein